MSSNKIDENLSLIRQCHWRQRWNYDGMSQQETRYVVSGTTIYHPLRRTCKRPTCNIGLSNNSQFLTHQGQKLLKLISREIRLSAILLLTSSRTSRTIWFPMKAMLWWLTMKFPTCFDRVVVTITIQTVHWFLPRGLAFSCYYYHVELAQSWSRVREDLAQQQDRPWGGAKCATAQALDFFRPSNSKSLYIYI